MERSQAVTGNEFFRTITEETLDYVMREMTCVDACIDTQQFRRAPKLPNNATGKVGGVAFYSTPDEIREVLGEEADAFIAAYGVTRRANFEGKDKDTLEFLGDMEHRPTVAEARQRLFDVREQRIHPGRDDVRWC